MFDELYLALFLAIAALFWTDFFEPVQGARESITYSLGYYMPERLLWTLTPLYCAKCLAFWGAIAVGFFGDASFLETIRVAMFASVLAYLIQPLLTSTDEDT